MLTEDKIKLLHYGLVSNFYIKTRQGDMENNNKRLNYIRTIAKNSLDQFLYIVNQNNDDIIILKKSWLNFINNDNDLKKFDICIKNFESLIGFKKELNPSLSEQQIVKKVGDRFAEIDLARHIIREYGLASKKLIKLTESNIQMCDFELLQNEFCVYCEAKFISSIGEERVKEKTKKSLEQIKSTINNHSKSKNNKGIVWIFSYKQPQKPKDFQEMIKNIKNSFENEYDFNFLLNVQTYGTGLYGDASTTKFNNFSHQL